MVDIDNKLGLQVVPDPDRYPGLIVQGNTGNQRVEGEDIEALEVDEAATERARVLEVQATLQGQNDSLLRQLQLIGQQPTPLMLVKLQLDTLLDFVIQDEEGREAFDTACHMNLNGLLKQALGQHYGIDLSEPLNDDERTGQPADDVTDNG